MLLIVTRKGRDYRPGSRQRKEQVARRAAPIWELGPCSQSFGGIRPAPFKLAHLSGTDLNFDAFQRPGTVRSASSKARGKSRAMGWCGQACAIELARIKADVAQVQDSFVRKCNVGGHWHCQADPIVLHEDAMNPPTAADFLLG